MEEMAFVLALSTMDKVLLASSNVPIIGEVTIMVIRNAAIPPQTAPLTLLKRVEHEWSSLPYPVSSALIRVRNR